MQRNPSKGDLKLLRDDFFLPIQIFKRLIRSEFLLMSNDWRFFERMMAVAKFGCIALAKSLVGRIGTQITRCLTPRVARRRFRTAKLRVQPAIWRRITLFSSQTNFLLSINVKIRKYPDSDCIQGRLQNAVYWSIFVSLVISLLMDFGIHSEKAWICFRPFLAYLS